MEKAGLIQSLNEALQKEYFDIFLYPREADIVKDKEVREKFEKFGRMELRHADNVAMQIFVLGGKPRWDFVLLETNRSIPGMLQDHLQSETASVQLYDKLIGLADEQGEDQLKLILEGIRSEEEFHLGVIKALLKKQV